MAEKLDLDALERANLGRVVRPDDWMALLAYARALECASQPGCGNAFVREFEEWVKQTGALPWGGSWMAEVSSIIERAAQGAQSGKVMIVHQINIDPEREGRQSVLDALRRGIDSGRTTGGHTGGEQKA